MMYKFVTLVDLHVPLIWCYLVPLKEHLNHLSILTDPLHNIAVVIDPIPSILTKATHLMIRFVSCFLYWSDAFWNHRVIPGNASKRRNSIGRLPGYNKCQVYV